MASFPTSVKTWTALVDASDYPEATDLNTVYDEITAIETGYLTGTAPLNSSASTLASLSVSGESSFIGALKAQDMSLVVGSLQLGSTTVTPASTNSTTIGVSSGIVLVDINTSSGGLTLHGIGPDPSTALGARILFVHNGGTTGAITFINESTQASSVKTRFLNPGSTNYTLNSQCGALLGYVPRQGRWCILDK